MNADNAGKKNGRSLVYIESVFSQILLRSDAYFDAKNAETKNGRSLVYIKRVCKDLGVIDMYIFIKIYKDEGGPTSLTPNEES